MPPARLSRGRAFKPRGSAPVVADTPVRAAARWRVLRHTTHAPSRPPTCLRCRLVLPPGMRQTCATSDTIGEGGYQWVV